MCDPSGLADWISGELRDEFEAQHHVFDSGERYEWIEERIRKAVELAIPMVVKEFGGIQREKNFAAASALSNTPGDPV